MRIATALVSAGAMVMVAAPVGSATAAPQRDMFELHCDDGQTYLVSTNRGNGSFTPARVVGTHQTLVPVSFGEFHFTATAPDGTVLFEGTEPPETKGQVAAHNPQPMITCTFSQSEVLAEGDPEEGLPPGTTVTFSGEVTGFKTGRR